MLCCDFISKWDYNLPGGKINNSKIHVAEVNVITICTYISYSVYNCLPVIIQRLIFFWKTVTSVAVTQENAVRTIIHPTFRSSSLK